MPQNQGENQATKDYSKNGTVSFGKSSRNIGSKHRNQTDESNKTETKSLIRLALILTNYISWYSCKNFSGAEPVASQ